MQPKAQAVGGQRETNEPQRGERSVATRLVQPCRPEPRKMRPSAPGKSSCPSTTGSFFLRNSAAIDEPPRPSQKTRKGRPPSRSNSASTLVTEKPGQPPRPSDTCLPVSLGHGNTGPARYISTLLGGAFKKDWPNQHDQETAWHILYFCGNFWP